MLSLFARKIPFVNNYELVCESVFSRCKTHHVGFTYFHNTYEYMYVVVKLHCTIMLNEYSD